MSRFVSLLTGVLAVASTAYAVDYTTLPEGGSTVGSLPEVVIDFGEGNTAEWTLGQNLPAPGLIQLYDGTAMFPVNGYIGKESSYSVRDGKLVITPMNGGLCPGKYYFKLEKSQYAVNGVQGDAQIKFNITVDESGLATAQKFDVTVDPVPAGIQNQLKTLTFTLPGDVTFVQPFKGNVMYSWTSAEEAASASALWFADDFTWGGCYVEDGNKLVLNNEKSTGIRLPEGETTAKVYVHVAAGTFAVNGVLNEAFDLEYVVGETPAYFQYETEPNGEQPAWMISPVMFNFNNLGEGMAINLIEGAKGYIKRNGEVVDGAEFKLEVFENFLNCIIPEPEGEADVEAYYNMISRPGIYEFVLPAGSIEINGIGNPEFVVTFEIPGVPLEYSVDPRAGYITEPLKVIRIVFDGEVELTEGCFVDGESHWGNAEINPRFRAPYGSASIEEGKRPQIFCNEAFRVEDGNTLYLERYMALDPERDVMDGSEWVEILVYGASYSVDGKPGEDLVIRYSFVPETGDLIVEPSQDNKVANVQVVKLSFYDSYVDLAENAELDFENGVYGNIDLVPTYTYAGATAPELFANYLFTSDGEALILQHYSELNQENCNNSDYITIKVKGDSYLVNDEPGEDIELTYIFDPFSAVKALFGEEAGLNVYDLQGRMVVKNGNAASLKALKGIYVINGKKVVL